jgi:hypothetical protein
MTARNIDNTVDGTGVYNTKIPGYDDAADIQQALRLYHYGSTTIPANLSQVSSASIAGHLKNIQSSLTALEELGYGAVYSPTPPSGVSDGYIWVDSDSTPVVAPGSTAMYQTEAPTENLTTGLLWVDSNSSPYLKMYVYSGTEWIEIGA